MSHDLVIGIWDTSSGIADRRVSEILRDLTISWTRYDYRGVLLEAPSVDQLLNQAEQRGDHWCLLLPYGFIIAERWIPDHRPARNLFAMLDDYITCDDFLVAGEIVGDQDTWFGFANACLLVNLDRYRQLSAPPFDRVAGGQIELPQVVREESEGMITALRPKGENETIQPTRDGWNWIAASLSCGLNVRGFDAPWRSALLNLGASSPEQTRVLAPYLREGIPSFCADHPPEDLSEDQVSFLRMVQPQTECARNGVFLWNIEGYDDIETPAADFRPPLDALYSVAAGFKPNRILHTHGLDASTRVVYYDYSNQALSIRKYLVDHWDGVDFPEFVAHLFITFPHPETFYQLWDGLTPASVSEDDIRQMWQRELARWGGARAFREHWQAYRQLPHEFVCCDLLNDPASLLACLGDGRNELIWWSNAFFTVYGNWFHTLRDRARAYRAWIEQLASLNPNLLLYGSDISNVNVNSLRAAEYWEAYQRADIDGLLPCRLASTEIRM